MNRRIATVMVALLFAASMSVSAASFKEWRKMIDAAQQARSEHDLQKARQILEKAGPDAARHGPDSFAQNSILLAGVLMDLDEENEALKTIDAALEKMGKPSRRSSVLWKGLLLAGRALLLHELRDHDAALADAESAARLVSMGSMGHPEVANIFWIIGEISSAKKDYVKAETAFRKGLNIAETRQSRGEFQAGRYVQYRSEYSSSGMLLNMTGLGMVCALQNRHEEAGAHFEKALKFAEKEYGKNHDAAIIPLSGRLGLFFKTKRRAEFEKDWVRIFEITQQKKRVEARFVAPLWLKARWESDEGNSVAAAETADKIVAIYDDLNFGVKRLASDVIQVASLEEEEHRDKVVRLQEVVRKAALNRFGEVSAKISPLHLEFGRDAERNKESTRARDHYDTVLRMQENGDSGVYVASAEKIAEILIAQNDPAAALPYRQKITAKLREKYGEDSRVAFALESEAALLKQLGRMEDAKEAQTKAAAIHAKTLLKR